MRKLYSILLLAAICSQSYCQIIKGIIQDENTKNPVSYAAVYFNGSFVGTYSDKNGFFELDVSNSISIPLVISALGYNSVSIPDISVGKYYRIFLKPKIFELNEVIISAKETARERRERRANIQFFRNVFIGETLNSQKCEILNEKDIYFKYCKTGDTIRAFALNPLLIENKALGYKISFDLVKFEMSRLKVFFFYMGNIMFLQDLSALEKKSKTYEKRRETAYMGSRMQFMRELWRNNLDSAGFAVTDSDNKRYTYNELVFQNDSPAKYLRKSKVLNLAYYSKVARTFLTVTKDSVAFTKDGNFDGTVIEWAGEMSRQRIGDQLPYEYSPSKKK
jgi:hypothetical protein